VWAALLFAATSLGGCQPTEKVDLLKLGEALCLDQKWEEAQAVLKQHLLLNPDDAGAHYYLGRCNVYGSVFWPEVARGEYETALQLFLSSGKENSIERFGAEYFEMILHLHSAEVLVKVVYSLNGNGVPLSNLKGMIENIESSVNEARNVSPDHPDVETYDALLAEIKRGLAQKENGLASR
jgi:tetratricopeptide (TPR) repeat protein